MSEQNPTNRTANRVAAGVPTGGQFAASARGEAAVDLTGLSRDSKTRIAERAAERLADAEWVQIHPDQAALYADEDFLAVARELEGQPLTLGVQFQHWDGRDNVIDAHSTTFDLAPVMTFVDDKNRFAMAEDVLADGYGNDEGDSLYFEARARGLVEDHDGPFYVYDPSSTDNTQMAAWVLANPAGDSRSALKSVLPDMYSQADATRRETAAAAARAEVRHERLGLAKRFLDEDVPPGATVALKIHGSSADEDGNCNVSFPLAQDRNGNLIEVWRGGPAPSKANRYGNTRYDMFLDDNDQDRISVDKVYAWVAAGAREDY